jgi:hypothetical protein
MTSGIPIVNTNAIVIQKEMLNYEMEVLIHLYNLVFWRQLSTFTSNQLSTLGLVLANNINKTLSFKIIIPSCRSCSRRGSSFARQGFVFAPPA